MCPNDHSDSRKYWVITMILRWRASALQFYGIVRRLIFELTRLFWPTSFAGVRAPAGHCELGLLSRALCCVLMRLTSSINRNDAAWSSTAIQLAHWGRPARFPSCSPTLHRCDIMLSPCNVYTPRDNTSNIIQK